jgi:hypothetical protein
MMRLKKLEWIGLATGAMILSIGALSTLQEFHGQQYPTVSPASSSDPEEYEANGQSQQLVSIEGGQYRLDYRFNDHKGRQWSWQWGWPEEETDAAIARFGVPQSLFNSYTPTPEVVGKRKMIISYGLFTKTFEGSITPDYDAILATYAPFTATLYQLLQRSVPKTGGAEQVKFLLKFVQDIPYGIPPDDIEPYNGGMLVAPDILIKKWGDCDSKAALFAGILLHDPTKKIVVIEVPNHVFLGIAGIPKPYQDFVEFQGQRYIFLEPVGPARTPFGKANSSFSFSSINRVFPLNALPRENLNKSYTLGEPLAKRTYDGEGLHVVEAVVKGGIIALKLKSNTPRTVIVHLEKDGQELPLQAFVQTDGTNQYKALAVAGSPGRYSLEVFSKKQDAVGSYPHSLSYPFEASEEVVYFRFPHSFNFFAETLTQLISPLKGELPRGQDIIFKIKVPGAKDVVLIDGEKWNHLTKGEDDLFMGQFTVNSKNPGIYAKHKGQKQFHGLLEYRTL